MWNIRSLFTAKGIFLVFFSTYSPKLNLCELVFAQVKNSLRSSKDERLLLIEDITLYFSLITSQNIYNYYKKCCFNKEK